MAHTACFDAVINLVKIPQCRSMQGIHQFVHGKSSMVVHDASFSMCCVLCTYHIYVMLYCITSCYTILHHIISPYMQVIPKCCKSSLLYLDARCIQAHKPCMTRCITATGRRSYSSSWQLHPQGRRRRRGIPGSVPA